MTTTEKSPESLDIDDIIESESQKNSQQLQIELCVLKSKMQTLELENKTLKEETESQKEKIKNFTDYFESIQDDEDNAERLKEEVREKDNELQRLSELITEEILSSEKDQKEYEIEISKLKGEIVALETETEQTKIELTKTKEVSQLSYDTYFNDITMLKDEKEALQLFFNKESEKMQIENKNLKEKIEQLQSKHDDLIEANTLSMTELIEKYTNDMKSLQQTQQNASKNFNEVKDLKAKVFKMEHEKELLKAEIASKQSLLNAQLKLNKELNENINKLNEENVALEGKIDEMKSNMLNDIGSKPDPQVNQLSNINGRDIQKQLEEALNELLKYKALDNAIKMNTTHSLMYKSDIKKLQNELMDYKKKFNGLIELQKQNENNQQIQQMKLGAIAEKRMTVKPIEASKMKMERVSNQSPNQNNNNTTATPKKRSIDYTGIHQPNDQGVNYKKNTLQEINNSFITNPSELQKQILFLTEQNKSYQKDIAMSIKNKEEIVLKINVLQEKTSTLETQLITKDREIFKYKILVNRLKLKERE